MLGNYLQALELEMEQKQDYLEDEFIESIFFGGGTPSLLSVNQISRILSRTLKLFPVNRNCEITLEANPDDLDMNYLRDLKNYTAVNRLSIGIQSFNDKILRLLNRRHNSKRALNCIDDAGKAGFCNIGIDLIYGIPGMLLNQWQEDIQKAFSKEIKHLSAYLLSIEPGTVLDGLQGRSLLPVLDEEDIRLQFLLLHQMARDHSFRHYEISNLAKDGYHSQHNSAYWQNKKYLGLGASAHSYNLATRQWNVSDVKTYLQAINQHKEFDVREDLGKNEHYNEYIMLSLRTDTGVNIKKLTEEFGPELNAEFLRKASLMILAGNMEVKGNNYRFTLQGWLISNSLLAELII
jgi:oxygen-independent coproporphyrinogen-3 oxidase